MTSELEVNDYEKNNEKIQANCSWITNELLQDIIRLHEKNDEIQVINHSVCAAVGVGDNYLSILYRTSIEFTRKIGGDVEKLQLMIKGAPTAKILLQMIEEIGIFKKELTMYNECLPAMKKIAQQYMPEEDRFIAAESYTCSLPNTIVMEDLLVLGYKMSNRRQQLDFDHCVVTLKTLARFHSLSLKVFESEPETIKKVSYDMYQDSNRDKMEPYLKMCFATWTKVIKGWEGFEKFAPMISHLNVNIYDKILHMCSANSALNVLNHGDSWTNNVMYKYDSEGNVIHAKLIDFQISRFTSPAMDIIYFLFTSPKAEILREKMFDLIQIYHDALISDLEKIGFDSSRFSLEQLHEEIRDRSLFAVLVLATVTPICLAKPSEAVDLDGFDPDKVNPDDEYPLINNYKDSHYKEVLQSHLSLLEEMGFFKYAEERLLFIDEKIAAKDKSSKDEESKKDITCTSAAASELVANL